jgi:kynurenine formamidase
MCLPETFETVQRRVEEESPPQAPHVDRRTLLVGGAAAAVAAAFPGVAEARRIPANRVQDLTHVFRAGFPIYGTPPTFNSPTRRTVVNVVPDGFYGQEWTFWEHSGTHMDVPGHFLQGGRFSPDITPRELIAPIVVVDISSRVATNNDAMVMPDDLRKFERRHGRIPRRAIVAMYSGWESRVGDANAFRNPDATGTLHFPGWSAEAVQWLLDRRRITGIGVDTLSLDPGNSTTFAAHLTILRANKYGIENLANLKRIRPRGATAFIGLVPWEAGSGGPLRAIAVW